jgi:hypothetical protein
MLASRAAAPRPSVALHAAGDYYGSAVAIAGNTAVVGAPGVSSQRGAVFVFARSRTGWHMQARLTDPGGASGDAFGFAVALSGSTLIIGAPFAKSLAGVAYIYTRSGTTWHKRARIIAPGDYFGYSVAISGEIIVVGAEGVNNAAGCAYIFRHLPSGGWSLAATLTDPSHTGYDYFGDAVALSGSTAVIGAPRGFQNTAAGRAYVYQRVNGLWRLRAVLKAARPTPSDAFGGSVALSVTRKGATIVIGAYGTRRHAGAAYIFTRSGRRWTRRARLLEPRGGTGDYFGQAVAISGGRVVVGAPNKGVRHCGRAFEFTKPGSAWRERAELVNTGCVIKDYFGATAAVSGANAVVGAPGRRHYAGQAYLLHLL